MSCVCTVCIQVHSSKTKKRNGKVVTGIPDEVKEHHHTSPRPVKKQTVSNTSGTQVGSGGFYIHVTWEIVAIERGQPFWRRNENFISCWFVLFLFAYRECSGDGLINSCGVSLWVRRLLRFWQNCQKALRDKLGLGTGCVCKTSDSDIGKRMTQLSTFPHLQILATHAITLHSCHNETTNLG